MRSIALIAADAPSSNIWSALPSMLWCLLAAAFVIWFHKPIRDVLAHLAWRLKSGSPVKLGMIDIGSVHYAPSNSMQATLGDVEDVNDASPREPELEKLLEETRVQYWDIHRRVTVVHKLFRSNEEGQVYDILIYVIPHKEGTLACVSKVEYYFGKYWNGRVFTATNRSTGFMIRTSAYGNFLCIARIHFTDAEAKAGPVTVFRYIDFEMGAYAPALEPDAQQLTAGTDR